MLLQTHSENQASHGGCAAELPARVTPQMACGEYLRIRREQAGLTLVDVARHPNVHGDVMEKVIFLAAYERSSMIARRRELERMRLAFPFDPEVYLTLAGGGRVRLCKGCGCSEFDPCDDAVNGGCSWVAADLCSGCAQR